MSFYVKKFGHRISTFREDGVQHAEKRLSQARSQIYTYSRYWIAVNSLVRAMEGSLDEGDKSRFCPPL
jgi:hypothetical protein